MPASVKRLLCLAAAAVLLVICAVPSCVLAQDLITYDDGYYIKDFTVDVTVNSDRSYDITETIHVYFNEERHGIKRNIPTSAALEREVRLENVSVEGAEYSYDGYGTIKIGSADYTVTGDMTYVISYTLWHYADPEPEHDYMYLNLIGTEWDTYIENYDCTVRLPDGAEVENITLTGGYSSETECISEYSYDPEKDIIRVTPLRGLNAYEGVTIDVEMKEGAFADAEVWEPDLIFGPMTVSMTLDEYGLLTADESFTVQVNHDSYVFIGYADYTGDETVSSQSFRTSGPEGTKDGSEGYCFVRLYDCEGETVEAEVSFSKQYNVRDGQDELIILQQIYYGTKDQYPGPVELDIELPFDAYSVAAYDDNSQWLAEERADCRVTGSGRHWHVSADPAPENSDDLYVMICIKDACFRKDIRRTEAGCWLGCVLVAGLAALFAVKGRPGRFNPVPEFYPPDGITPPEAGYFYKAKAEPSDMAGMIYYWASKGLLRIRFGKKDSFTLHREELPDDYEFRQFELPLWNGLWGRKLKSDVKKSDLESRFYKKIDKAVEDMVDACGGEDALIVKRTQKLGALISRWIPDIYTVLFTGAAEAQMNSADEGAGIAGLIFALILINSIYRQSRRRALSGAYTDSRIIAGNIWTAVKTLITMLIFAEVGGGYVMHTAAAALSGLIMCAAAFSYQYIVRRSEYGYEKLEQVEGFRMFLETAEKERLEMLLEQDPDYFYNILPYAQALGVTKKWVRRFDGLLVREPSWLDNNSGHVFSYTDYSRLEGRISSAATSMPASSGGGGGFSSGGSSGGGSFSSGGSSGGGSGGGGGSSW